MVKGSKSKSVSFGVAKAPQVSIISESSSVDITDGAKMSKRPKSAILKKDTFKKVGGVHFWLHSQLTPEIFL